MTSEIAEPITVEMLVALGRGNAPRHPVRLDESLPLPESERMVWERRLNRYRHSCGCAEGAVGLCVGLLIVLTAYLLQTGPWTGAKIGAFVALPLLLVGVGKLIGRRLDALRFRKACKQLSLRLAVNG